jgi:hypothetical protein
MWNPSINYLNNSGKTLTSNEKLNQHVMKFSCKKKNMHCAMKYSHFTSFFGWLPRCQNFPQKENSETRFVIFV